MQTCWPELEKTIHVKPQPAMLQAAAAMRNCNQNFDININATLAAAVLDFPNIVSAIESYSMRLFLYVYEHTRVHYV